MTKRLYSNFQIIWILIIIPLLSFIFLKQTLNLALYGDDWEQLYNLWLSFDVLKTSSFLNIKSYLSPYWPQYVFLGGIRHFFGYEPTAYFASSMILRILATISLFFLVKKLTKKSLPAYLATLVFTFSAAGLQTTDWVFNMNTYAGVFFLNISIIFYFKLRDSNVSFFLNYVLFITLFLLALGIVPVRMHGAVIFIALTEIFLYLFARKEGGLRPYKYFFLRIITPFLILLILLKVGSFGNTSDNVPLNTGLTYLGEMVQKGRYDAFFYFLGIIGNISIPDNTINSLTFGHFSVLILYFVVADSILTIALKGGKRIFTYLLIFNILGVVLGKLISIWNPLISSGNILSILIGTHIITASLIIFWQFRKTYFLQAASIIIGLFWLISFSFLYWVRNPSLIIETTARYLTMGAYGFAILFAGLIGLMIERALTIKKIMALSLLASMFILVFWLKINLDASNKYLNNLEENRNIALTNKAWSVLLQNVPVIDKENPSVFYFSTDNTTAIYMIFSFGFPPHGGLLYQIPDWLNTPIPTEHYEELLKMVSSGDILRTLHGRKPIPVPLSRVFAFDFRNGELTNITTEIRQKLTTDLKLKGEN